MARFNPEANLQPPASPDFTGASRGQTGDRSLGVLFEGMGNLARGLGPVIDRQRKKNIRADVTQAFDAANQLFTKTNQDQFGADANIQKAENSARRLQQAWEAGILSDTEYYGRLDVEMRKVRAKYPNRREDVDNIIQDVTGVRPANAARRARIAEFEEEQRRTEAQATRDEKWIDDNRHTIYQIFGDAYERNPGNFPLPMLKAEVARFEADRAKVLQTTQDANMVLATVQANSTVAKENAQRAMDAEGANRVQHILNGAANVLGINFNQKDFRDQLASIAEREHGLTPEELTEITNDLNLIQGQLEAELYAQFAQTVEVLGADGEPQLTTYGAILTSQKQSEMIKNYMQPLEALKRMVTDGEIGAASRELAATNLAKQRAEGAIAKLYPELLTVGEVRKMSPALATQLELHLAQTKPLAPLLKKVIIATVTGKEKFDRTFQAIKDDETWPTADKHTLANELLDIVPNLLTNPKIQKRDKEDIVRKLYSDPDDALFNFVDPQQHIELFQKMAHPAITQAVDSLGNEELRNGYIDWVIGKFAQMPQWRMAASNVFRGLKKSGFAVQYNLETRQFDNVSKPFKADPSESFAQRAGKGAVDAAIQRQADEALTEINSALRILFPTLDLMGDRAGPQEVQDIIELLGVRLKIGPEERDQSLYSIILDAISGVPQGDVSKIKDRETGNRGSDAFQNPTKFFLEGFKNRAREEEDPEKGLAPPPEEPEVEPVPAPNPEDDFDFGFTSGSLDDNLQPIAAALDIGEGATYDTALAHSEDRFFPEGLTNMTLRDILAVQGKRGKGSMHRELGLNSTAVGRFQFVGKTLKQLVAKEGIDLDEKFTPAMQNRLFKAKLLEHGFEDYIAGDLSLNTFMKRLGKEWQGVEKNVRSRRALKAALIELGA